MRETPRAAIRHSETLREEPEIPEKDIKSLVFLISHSIQTRDLSLPPPTPVVTVADEIFTKSDPEGPSGKG